MQQPAVGRYTLPAPVSENTQDTLSCHPELQAFSIQPGGGRQVQLLGRIRDHHPAAVVRRSRYLRDAAAAAATACTAQPDWPHMTDTVQDALSAGPPPSRSKMGSLALNGGRPPPKPAAPRLDSPSLTLHPSIPSIRPAIQPTLFLLCEACERGGVGSTRKALLPLAPSPPRPRPSRITFCHPLSLVPSAAQSCPCFGRLLLCSLLRDVNPPLFLPPPSSLLLSPPALPEGIITPSINNHQHLIARLPPLRIIARRRSPFFSTRLGPLFSLASFASSVSVTAFYFRSVATAILSGRFPSFLACTRDQPLPPPLVPASSSSTSTNASTHRHGRTRSARA